MHWPDPNLQVTRFVPVSVKLRQRLPEERPAQLPVQQTPAPEAAKPDEGVDAYSAFMSEMEGLM